MNISHSKSSLLQTPEDIDKHLQFTKTIYLNSEMSKDSAFDLEFYNLNLDYSTFEQKYLEPASQAILSRSKEAHDYRANQDNHKEILPINWIPTVLSAEERKTEQQRVLDGLNNLSKDLENTDTIIIIGFGGSFVTSHFLSKQFLDKTSNKQVIFINNSDYLLDSLNAINNATKPPVILTVSLSGSTQSLLAHTTSISKQVQNANKTAYIKIITNTLKQDNLLIKKVTELAASNNNLKFSNNTDIFHLDPKVGGRYSTDQINSLAIASLLNINCEEIYTGINNARDSIQSWTCSNNNKHYSLATWMVAYAQWQIEQRNTRSDSLASTGECKSYIHNNVFASVTTSETIGAILDQLIYESLHKESLKTPIIQEFYSGENEHHSKGEKYQQEAKENLSAITFFDLYTANDEVLQNADYINSFLAQYNYVGPILTGSVLEEGSAVLRISKAHEYNCKLTPRQAGYLMMTFQVYMMGYSKILDHPLREFITQDNIESGKNKNKK